MSKHALQLVIVDDDDDVRSAVEALAHETYPLAEIASFATSFSAIEKIHQGATDLLITNCHMPDMDGPTLVKTLRAEKFSLPILMVSSSDDARELGEKAGIDGFVEKQSLFRQLPTALRELLEHAA